MQQEKSRIGRYGSEPELTLVTELALRAVLWVLETVTALCEIADEGSKWREEMYRRDDQT